MKVAPHAPDRTPRRVSKSFNARVVRHLHHEPLVEGLRNEMRVISREHGRPMGYPLRYGLVLTELGVRHALRASDGSIFENRPLYAWPLRIGDDAAAAEAAVREDLAAYGEGQHQWVYPVGRPLEQRQEEDLKGLCCCPCLSVAWALRAATRLGRRQPRGPQA